MVPEFVRLEKTSRLLQELTNPDDPNLALCEAKPGNCAER
jgi:hypothetical protein